MPLFVIESVCMGTRLNRGLCGFRGVKVLCGAVSTHRLDTEAQDGSGFRCYECPGDQQSPMLQKRASDARNLQNTVETVGCGAIVKVIFSRGLV